MTTPYVSGTVSVTAGSAVVTGVGTGWATALLTGGMFGLDSANGNPVPIASIDSNTQLTLAKPWRGTTAATQAYWIMRDTAYGEQTVANATALAQIINELRSAGLAAFAGLTPAADKVPYFSGPNSAALADIKAKGRDLLAAADSAAALQALGLLAVQATGNDYDVTQPRLMRVGSFGLGRTTIQGDVDLNTQLATGFYYLTNPTNGPTGSDTGWCLVQNHPAANYNTQMLIPATGARAGVPYFRTMVNGAWQAWRPVGIERGSNANGEFVRFPDGTQICWYTLPTGPAMESRSEGAYTMAFSSIGWNFPAVFLVGTIPSFTVSFKGNTTGGAIRVFAGSSYNSIDRNGVSYRLWTADAASGPATAITAMAVGRWF